MDTVIKQGFLLMVGLMSLVSCGTGGDSEPVLGSGSGSGGSVSGDHLTWQKGVFKDESHYKHYCKAPRTGVNSEGKPYPDKSGSTLHELHWLRSWSHNTYLWYNEIVDRDISTFTRPETYFKTLKTFAVTDSGKLRDRFHFYQDTAEYEKQVSGSASASYGARFIWVATTPPRELRVAYTEPNSPAVRAGLARGAEIIRVDGVDVKSATGDANIDALIKGVYPSANGEAHAFVVRDANQASTKNITLTAQTVTTSPVHHTKVISTNTGDVGYLTFNTFASVTAEKALKDAFATLRNQNIKDLVIDLRYNGGGYLAISAQLGYMVAGTRSENHTFERTVFNDKHPDKNPVTGNVIRPMPFIPETIGFGVAEGERLPTVGVGRVFILTSEYTCSASEALINGLRGIDVEVIQIGETTCGKPYGFYSTDNCGITYSSIQFRGENEKGFGDYADGFAPSNSTQLGGERVTGCQVQDDFLHALGDENEGLLKAALDYRVNGRCPTMGASRVAVQSSEGEDVKQAPRFVEHELKQRIKLDALRLIPVDR